MERVRNWGISLLIAVCVLVYPLLAMRAVPGKRRKLK